MSSFHYCNNSKEWNQSWRNEESILQRYVSIIIIVIRVKGGNDDDDDGLYIKFRWAFNRTRLSHINIYSYINIRLSLNKSLAHFSSLSEINPFISLYQKSDYSFLQLTMLTQESNMKEPLQEKDPRRRNNAQRHRHRTPWDESSWSLSQIANRVWRPNECRHISVLYIQFIYIFPCISFVLLRISRGDSYFIHVSLSPEEGWATSGFLLHETLSRGKWDWQLNAKLIHTTESFHSKLLQHILVSLFAILPQMNSHTPNLSLPHLFSVLSLILFLWSLHKHQSPLM